MAEIPLFRRVTPRLASSPPVFAFDPEMSVAWTSREISGGLSAETRTSARFPRTSRFEPSRERTWSGSMFLRGRRTTLYPNCLSRERNGSAHHIATSPNSGHQGAYARPEDDGREARWRGGFYSDGNPLTKEQGQSRPKVA